MRTLVRIINVCKNLRSTSFNPPDTYKFACLSMIASNDEERNCKYNRVFRLEPDIAILYRFVLQNEKTKYYPTPSGNRTWAP